MGRLARGCLGAVASLVALSLIALTLIAGLVLRVGWGEFAVGRFGGAAMVALSGAALIAASKSTVFANVLSLLAAPEHGLASNDAYDRDYRQQTGMHPGPLVFGVLIVLAAIVLAILGP